MVEPVITWSQFGLAGIIAVSLGGVIGYVFRLFVRTQTSEMERLIRERDGAIAENERLHTKIEEQQREALGVLGDVSRVLSEVQQMMRAREIQATMEREFQRREQHGQA